MAKLKYEAQKILSFSDIEQASDPEFVEYWIDNFIANSIMDTLKAKRKQNDSVLNFSFNFSRKQTSKGILCRVTITNQ